MKRIIVAQADSGKTTIFDLTLSDRSSTGDDSIEEYDVEGDLPEIPARGLAVSDFAKWKNEREEEGAVFHVTPARF